MACLLKLRAENARFGFTSYPAPCMIFEGQPKSGIWRRRRARRALVQAAYQSQISGLPLAQIEKDFLNIVCVKVTGFFSDVFRKMASKQSELDE